MKTIGMLGGMSWESTASYYKAVNEGIKSELGGLHSAKIALYSVDFDAIEKLQHEEKWEETAQILSQAAQAVEAAGADFLLICTNTMHKVAPQIEKKIRIPLLHIADATAARLQQDGIEKVGLLGTRFTMQEDFYKTRLTHKFGIDVLVPDTEDQEYVHAVIYNELCLGKCYTASREVYLKIIKKLHDNGAEAVILGCTEIALLIQQKDTDIPLYDTTTIHAERAVEEALRTN